MKVNKDKIQSFRVHPLGFYYLTLSSGIVTRRLHVYGGEVDFSAENAWHTHEFDLKSRILVGTMKNYIAEFIVGAEGNLKEFSVDYKDGRSILSETGRLGSISELATFASSAGQDYFIKAGTIHRAVNIQSPCVTHVSMKHQGSRIFSYGVQEAPFARRQVNTTEASELMDILSQNHLLSSL